MITGDPKTPFFAYKLSANYHVTRVIVEEVLAQDYYRLETGGRVHGAELHITVTDAIAVGKQKILALERSISRTQTKINERKAALKKAERMAQA